MKRAFHHKMKVLALVDRSTGQSRAIVIDDVSPSTIIPIVREIVRRESRIMTDQGNTYRKQLEDFGGHDFVTHGRGEYDRGDIHTNTIEGYFSIFKRGMKGIYQHCAEKHLHRYLAEFDFRYCNRSANGIEDIERAAEALRDILWPPPHLSADWCTRRLRSTTAASRLGSAESAGLAAECPPFFARDYPTDQSSY